MSIKPSNYISRLGNRQPLNSRGDTIVEVLLAIAVVSAVLGGAYVSANRSYGNVRQSQERSEASKYVEGQLERLKEASSKDATFFNTPPPAPHPYCLDNALNRLPPANAACNVGPDGRYHLSIERTGDHVFTAKATWDRYGGGPQEEVKIVYRLYQQ